MKPGRWRRGYGVQRRPEGPDEPPVQEKRRPSPSGFQNRLLAPYLGFVAASFHKMLAYRLRYYTGIATYLIYVATYYFLWRAVYGGEHAAELQGYTLAEMVSYVAAGWIARSFYFNNVDREIADLVAEGEIANVLVRPLSFHGVMVASSLGESLFRLLFFTGPIALVLFLLFPLRGPATPLAAAAFAVSVLLALLVFVHVNFLVGISALSLKSIWGVMRAKHYLVELLSGLILPLPFFPGWLQRLTGWLPFQAMAYVPAQVYLGRVEGAALAGALASQAAWAAGLALASAWAWRRAARRLVVQGG